jgi:flagellar biogenesis protein FliO
MMAAAARAALVLTVIAAVVLLVRRRARVAAGPSLIGIVARDQLAPGLGLAVVETHGRRLLVGWGKEGVRLVRDLGGCSRETP